MTTASSFQPFCCVCINEIRSDDIGSIVLSCGEYMCNSCKRSELSRQGGDSEGNSLLECPSCQKRGVNTLSLSGPLPSDVAGRMADIGIAVDTVQKSLLFQNRYYKQTLKRNGALIAHLKSELQRSHQLITELQSRNQSSRPLENYSNGYSIPNSSVPRSRRETPVSFPSGNTGTPSIRDTPIVPSYGNSDRRYSDGGSQGRSEMSNKRSSTPASVLWSSGSGGDIVIAGERDLIGEKRRTMEYPNNKHNNISNNGFGNSINNSIISGGVIRTPTPRSFEPMSVNQQFRSYPSGTPDYTSSVHALTDGINSSQQSLLSQPRDPQLTNASVRANESSSDSESQHRLQPLRPGKDQAATETLSSPYFRPIVNQRNSVSADTGTPTTSNVIANQLQYQDSPMLRGGAPTSDIATPRAATGSRQYTASNSFMNTPTTTSTNRNTGADSLASSPWLQLSGANNIKSAHVKPQTPRRLTPTSAHVSNSYSRNMETQSPLMTKSPSFDPSSNRPRTPNAGTPNKIREPHLNMIVRTPGHASVLISRQQNHTGYQ